MKRTAALLVTVLLLITSPVIAAKSPRGKAGFWDALKVKLQRVVPEERQGAPDNSMGTVQKDLSDVLYWKGGEETIAVPEAELAAFNRALQPAYEGKGEEAIAGFEEFLKKYPKSVLAEDARAALEQLKGGKTK